MTAIKISVVIPVYNAKNYLFDCIKSLLDQTLSDCEFIFVNDGSTDNSREIIEKYQKEDSRLILINQENKGIGEARNSGVNIANGEYIGFLDNDDFIKDDFLECLYNKAIKDDLDILISKTILGRDGKFIIKDNRFEKDLIFDKTFIKKNIIPNLLRVEDLFAVWNKIYKRSFINENSIRFPGNRVIEEDNMFNLQAFNKAEKVLFTDYAGYYYREVANSKSRLTIENDYFSKALEKYNFDFKKEYDLSISSIELEKLKAIRFIQRIFYLVYKCSVSKIPFKIKWNYIKGMIFHEKVYELAKNYHEEVIEGKGIYEKILLKIILHKSTLSLLFLTLSIRFFYHPRISETIRNINKLSKK
ncbi:glycosyltransferase [Flavobacterium bizetiae]|nr:glycosyltransferase [Flavobacterium bizetiae]CAD5349669.1 putative glycosyltransferase EpsJ [Flavobacterium bizetiae]